MSGMAYVDVVFASESQLAAGRQSIVDHVARVRSREVLLPLLTLARPTILCAGKGHGLSTLLGLMMLRERRT